MHYIDVRNTLLIWHKQVFIFFYKYIKKSLLLHYLCQSFFVAVLFMSIKVYCCFIHIHLSHVHFVSICTCIDLTYHFFHFTVYWFDESGSYWSVSLDEAGVSSIYCHLEWVVSTYFSYFLFNTQFIHVLLWSSTVHWLWVVMFG